MEACQKYIIETKKDLTAGHNCLLASSRCIAEHYGCNYSETQLFLISNGFHIRYGNNPNYIGRYTTGGLNEFGKRTMIPVTIRSRDKEGISPEEMVQALSSSMLILSVDTRHLSYNKLYAENENRQHAIVLNGIDFNEKCVHIMDLYVLDYSGNVSVYRGTISFDEMLAATYRYSYFCFDNKKDLTKPEILRYAYADFMEFLKGSENSEGTYGALALKNFLKGILKLEELDDCDLASTSKNINYNIKIRSFNYINKYLAYFLEENTDLTSRHNAELLEQIRWLMAEWEKIGLSIIRIGISKRKGSLTGVYEKSLQLFESQLKAYEQFSCVLEEAASNCI